MIHFQPKVKSVYFALLATLAVGGLGLRIGMQALDVYLKRHKIPACEGIDTRRLTRKLRTQGAMRGVLAMPAMVVTLAVLQLSMFWLNVPYVKR